MSTLMDEVLFALPEWPEKQIRFDAARVRERLAKVLGDDDLRKYIL
jgi:ATP-dependent protease HslVU (ClpYQ) ATPase subunit